MNEVITFGQFFKQHRIGLRKTLRQFCRDHGLNPGNISKLERDRIQAPVQESILIKYAKYLELDSVDLQTFKDLARDREVSEDFLQKVIELIRNS